MRFVLGTMHDLFQKFRNQPRLVIAIDEAHTLTPNQRDEWRPSIVFCRAIADFSTVNEGKYWVVFTSTTSKVADFAASRVKCELALDTSFFSSNICTRQLSESGYFRAITISSVH